MSRKLVLASESFLKHFILEKAKLKFTAIPANIDETIYDDLDVAKRVVALAHDKAEVVAKLSPDAIIVSADVLTMMARFLPNPVQTTIHLKQPCHSAEKPSLFIPDALCMTLLSDSVIIIAQRSLPIAHSPKGHWNAWSGTTITGSGVAPLEYFTMPRVLR